ncbi:hypothetical protein [Isachenkonia alkalipeptolytica]|uniref:Uncharacterized protein n=1 Tax=Isachenkonia alkalipeptolytica TaxID=2565777 RepID=A0AA44BDD3_9CLOT|nr:hypothetical protein [Isachenkonia alkalipeptolytica]NBG88199.1 hypothetical protein [Isachenkonia alkalipeptolytica]
MCKGGKDRKGFILKLMLVLSLLIASISVVYGNSGPPTVRPSDQKMVFDENSGVALQEEWVTIIMESEEQGIVEVRYVMENISREEENLEMLFILPERSDSLEVFWNNERIEIEEEVSRTRLPSNWRASELPLVHDPLSGMSLRGEYSVYGSYGNSRGKLFTVDLPLGETGELTLHYPSYSGIYQPTEVINSIYHQVYYLTPALFWEGDAKVNLEFQLPEGDYAVDSNIPMEKAGEGIYHGTLEELPQEEWLVGFVSTSGLFLGTNVRVIHNVIVAAVMAVMATGILWLSIKKDPKYKWLGLVLIPMIFLFRVGWGLFLLAVFAGPLVLTVLVVWLLAFLYKRYVRRSAG